MASAATPVERTIVDLLATWGATAAPGAEQLFEILERGPQTGGADAVASLLALPQGWLDDATRAELTALAASPTGPGPASRRSGLLSRARAALGSRIAERREELGGELAAWAPTLDPAESRELFEGLWLADGADGDEPAIAVQALADLRQRLDRLREQRTSELRDLLATDGADQIGVELRKSVQGAIDSNDPAALADARDRLEQIRQREARKQLDLRVEAARSRLAAVCESCRGIDVAGRPAGILAGALKDAENELGSAPANDPSRLDAIEALERTLQGIHESLTGPLETARRERGGLSLRAALDRALAVSRTEEPDPANAGGRTALAHAAAKLEEGLAAAAELLPAEQIVAARRLIEQATSLPITADADTTATLVERLERADRDAVDTSERARKLQRGRGESRRARLEAEADRLRAIADDRVATQLETWVRDLAASAPADLEALEDELQALARPVENAVRLGGARALEAARKRSAGEPDAEIPEALAALESALADDDLPKIAEATDRLPVSGIGSGRLRAALAAAAVVLVLAALVIWRSFASDTSVYVLRLGDDTRSPSSPLTVMLVHEGDVFDTQPYDGTSGATFHLPPGIYEIFVNDSYTGRTVRVPDDANEVVGIPLPPASRQPE